MKCVVRNRHRLGPMFCFTIAALSLAAQRIAECCGRDVHRATSGRWSSRDVASLHHEEYCHVHEASRFTLRDTRATTVSASHEPQSNPTQTRSNTSGSQKTIWYTAEASSLHVSMAPKKTPSSTNIASKLPSLHRGHDGAGESLRVAELSGQPDQTNGAGSALSLPIFATASRAAKCASITSLSSGITPTSAQAVDWPGCNVPQNKLVWIGERCGAGMDKIKYTAVYAISRSTSTVAMSKGNHCIATAESPNRAWARKVFGTRCGAAPTSASTLPVSVCLADVVPCASVSPPTATGSLPTVTVTLKNPVTCDAESTNILTYTAQPCGPGNRYLKWIKARTPLGCQLSAVAIRRLATVGGSPPAKAMIDFFGSCGSLPGLIDPTQPLVCNSNGGPPIVGSKPPTFPLPSPLPSPVGQFLPKRAVLPGEQVPTNIKMIEAVQGQLVPDLSQLPADKVPILAIADSGIDSTHPDLNYVGGISYIQASAAFPEDNNPGVDYYGHGTMVAGVAGAKNNGAGIVGISPGVPIFSLKVLGGAGNGGLSSVIQALQWAATDGRSKGVRVINISLAVRVARSDPTYPSVRDAVCSATKAASDAGVLVVTAAGNDGQDLLDYFPAACPTVAAVTEVNAAGDKPAANSNWLDDTSATPEDKARVIAAPGTRIYSTAPKDTDPSRYYTLSGTSLAAPHVSAVALNCLISGSCEVSSTGMQILASIQTAAAERANTLPAYGTSPSVNGRYYGRLIWHKY